VTVLDLFSLDGATVVVTGAGGGLGQAIAVAAAQAHGRVVCADINAEHAAATAAIIQDAGGDALAVETDVADEPSVSAMIDLARREYESVDVVFCNAGISGYYRRIDEVDVAEWRRVLDVNLTGVMLTAKYASRIMIQQGSGKLVLTSSIWGFIGSDSVPISDYAASKGGVVNLTRELALELAPHGITVNGIAPGFFNTKIGQDKNTPTDIKAALRAASLQLIPTHRRAEADEIAGTAIFLASRASDMLSGHVVVVDAGCLAR
jgi:gluconate 5-dehydrogenase